MSRYINALFVAAFGIMLLAAGALGGVQGFGVLVVLAGLATIGYAGFIAFTDRSYLMLDWFYALPIVGALVLFAAVK